MAKRSFHPQVAYPELKVQVRDLVRVVGIVVPFAPRGMCIRGNSFYRATGGKWAQETCVGCPQQRYATGKPGKYQGRDRVGSVEGSCGYGARRISIRGKFVLSRNPGYKTGGAVMWLNVLGGIRFIEHQGVNGHRCPRQRYASGEPGKAQGRDRVGIVEGSRGYRTRGVSIRGTFVLSRNPGSPCG